MIRLIVYEPANIVYPRADIVLTRSEQSIQYAPLVTNGSVLEWSIMPQLPLGLYFDNGLIYGQPLSNQSSTMYRVFGNNSGGISFVDLTITIYLNRHLN